MTQEEIDEYFPDHLHNVPEYDEVQVKHVLHKRSHDNMELELKINDKKLYLNPIEGYFAGKRTKVWSTTTDPLNRNKLRYTLQEDIMEDVGTFYQDLTTSSAILLRIDEEGTSHISPLPFVIESLRPGYSTFIMSEYCQNRFGEFMFREKFFQLQKDYDAIILMTDKNLLEKGTNDVLSGIARVGGICRNVNYRKLTLSTGIIVDKGDYQSVLTAAHELVHLLGPPHDGEGSFKIVGGKGSLECSSKDGYLMSYVRGSRNEFFLSKCSQKIISYYTSLAVTECLRNSPFEKIGTQLTRMLPGKLMTLDEQCRKAGYNSASKKKNPSVCLMLECYLSESDQYELFSKETNAPAAEGSFCGDRRYCLNGKCVPEIAETKLPAVGKIENYIAN
ncbi:venom metalloproteinase antarease-like TtrivMP_A [Leptopilina boulardi]|uniref:venom metalloproteinase antarease-like TtrivMP_A n=1 Tax=Leptopilina boulardi TaxID=63433 RepID=UPI0021F52BBF|nr:venom metalloproteinase antarease-like TtrivMP_A [Leptopilina boulardi]